MVNIQSPTAGIRRGKKKERRRKIEITGQKYRAVPTMGKLLFSQIRIMELFFSQIRIRYKYQM